MLRNLLKIMTTDGLLTPCPWQLVGQSGWTELIVASLDRVKVMLYADSKHLKLSNYDFCFWKIKMNINILEHRGSWVIEPAKGKAVG